VENVTDVSSLINYFSNLYFNDQALIIKPDPDCCSENIYCDYWLCTISDL